MAIDVALFHSYLVVNGFDQAQTHFVVRVAVRAIPSHWGVNAIPINMKEALVCDPEFSINGMR